MPGNPLQGLTGEQADEQIDRLTTVIDERKASLKAAEAHLKELRAARKDLVEPGAPDPDAPQATADAGAANGAGKANP